MRFFHAVPCLVLTGRQRCPSNQHLDPVPYPHPQTIRSGSDNHTFSAEEFLNATEAVGYSVDQLKIDVYIVDAYSFERRVNGSEVSCESLP